MTGPHVVLDTALDDGLLWLIVENVGDESAHRISVRFSRKLMGLGGDVEVSDLPLFNDLGFLAPGKHHRIVLDRADLFLTGRRTHVFTAVVSFEDDRGRPHTTKARHNLAIYKEYPTTPGR